jgi:Tol biopolymer transport system component
MKTHLAGVLAAILSLSAYETQAQEKPKPPKWDVNAPTGAIIRQVPIRVDEGSWMDLDVSPDGKTLAFNLLGDIYVMPITGGTPTRIAEGLAWEAQPRFSPDGKRIAFTSDRGGGDNIWIMNADGSDKRQVTKEDFRLLNQPTWSPDGRFIAAKKHFTTARSLGTGEVWLYHVSGGAGVPLVKRPSESHQKELGEPVYARDGKSIFYTRNITPGPIFEYAQDSNTDLFNIERYDLETGEISTAVSGAGGSVRPAPSPDGRMIAFVRRERTKSKLYVKDLASGVERKIYDALDQDVQEVWAVSGLYPNMAWTPDSKTLVFWAGGKIRRIDADGTKAAVIPFRIDDTRGVIDAPHPQVEVSPDRFTTKMPRFAAVSPDGRTVVFETLGKLWLRPVAGGAPRRLTRDESNFELFPAWSRDGKSIAFVSWSDKDLGRVKVIPAAGGAARDVTSQPGHYARPAFSPDGRTIVFEKGAGGRLTSGDWSNDPGVYRAPASGGVAVRVAKTMASPRFGASNDRLFMVTSEKGRQLLVSTDLNGEARRTHAAGDLVADYIVSPDGRNVAFRQNYEVSVMPLMPGTQEVATDIKGGPFARDSRLTGRGRLHPLERRGRASALECGTEPLHRGNVGAVPQRAAGRGRAKVRTPRVRGIPRHGGRRRPTPWGHGADGRADRHHDGRQRRGDRGRGHRDPRPSHCGDRPSRRGRCSGGRARGRYVGQDHHSGPDRRPRPRSLWGRRAHPAAEHVSDRQPGAGRHHDAQPLQPGLGGVSGRRAATDRGDPGAANLLDRRDRLWGQVGAELRPDRQPGRRPGACAASQGAGRA